MSEMDADCGGIIHYCALNSALYLFAVLCRECYLELHIYERGLSLY